MKISECDAVILAGGFGTRIKDMLPEGCPKIINGTPFIQIQKVIIYLTDLCQRG